MDVFLGAVMVIGVVALVVVVWLLIRLLLGLRPPYG